MVGARKEKLLEAPRELAGEEPARLQALSHTSGLEKFSYAQKGGTAERLSSLRG